MLYDWLPAYHRDSTGSRVTSQKSFCHSGHPKKTSQEGLKLVGPAVAWYTGGQDRNLNNHEVLVRMTGSIIPANRSYAADDVQLAAWAEMILKAFGELLYTLHQKDL